MPRFPGVTASAAPVDMPALIGGKSALVESMGMENYLDLAAGYSWAMLEGDAAFAGTQDAPTIEVTSSEGAVTRIEAAHYLVATGSAPWVPPIPGLDESGHLTSTTAMELNEVPDSLLILGGGYVALELAQLFARLGSQVTMLVRSRLASREEPEVSKTLGAAFADEGIRVVRRATVESVTREEDDGTVVVRASVAGRHEVFRASRLLVALGRRPVTEGLNLESVGVKTGTLGEIVVDSGLASSNPRIWGAGDVTGHREFVYVAAAHGALAVENAFTAAATEVNYRNLPRVTFTSPAVGAVGMTEKEAVATGIRCDCRVLPLEYVPRALVNRDTRGFIKVVADLDTGEIVGITAVAKDAGELAAAGVYVLEAGMTTTQVAAAWSPYLTMAEGIRIDCKAFSIDVSKLSCCA